MAKRTLRFGPGGYVQLIQPNRHPETARSSAQKPANRAVAVPIGGGTYVLQVGGSRPKP